MTDNVFFSAQRPRAELCDGTLRDTAVRGQTWSVLMERRLAVVWTYLLGAGLALGNVQRPLLLNPHHSPDPCALP